MKQAVTAIALAIALLFGLRTSAQIFIIDMEPATNETLCIWFHAENTASTNYSVEFTPFLSDSNQWISLQEVQIADIGSNFFEALALPLTNSCGFYRILSAGGLRAWFDTAELTVDEGAGTINIMIHFNGYFTGALYYSIEGTGTDSIENPAGTLQVDGISATLSLTLLDNASIDQLRYLSIALRGTAGLSVASPGTTTVNIMENDAAWQGVLETGTGTLGFQLQIIDDGATHSGAFGGGGFGFFPSNPIPAEIELSDAAFTASVTNISFAAETTLFETPMQLTLDLFADETFVGGNVQHVTSNLIEGIGILTIDIPAMPHLNATNRGTFVLRKPPVAPSTNEVELVHNP